MLWTFVFFGETVTCVARFIRTANYNVSFVVAVRLAGTGLSYKGRLEVFYNGTWGTVCSDSFSNTDAKVFCYQLNFGWINIIIMALQHKFISDKSAHTCMDQSSFDYFRRTRSNRCLLHVFFNFGYAHPFWFRRHLRSKSEDDRNHAEFCMLRQKFYGDRPGKLEGFALN